MSEPSGEDQPETTAVPDDGYGLGEPDGVGNPAAEEFSRFASYIGRSSMPGDRAAIERSARDLDAPDDVLAIIAALPEGTTFQNVTEVWASRGEQQ